MKAACTAGSEMFVACSVAADAYLADCAGCSSKPLLRITVRAAVDGRGLRPPGDL